MVLVKLYSQLEDVEPVTSLNVDSVEMGYARRGRDLAEANLKATMVLTVENTSSMEMDSNYPDLFKYPFRKVELISEETTETIDNMALLCHEVLSKMNTSGNIYSTFSFKEFSE